MSTTAISNQVRFKWQHQRRVITSHLVMGLSVLATMFALFWLLWILGTAFSYGVSALDLTLFTKTTPPPGESGGLANAFYGSLVMVLIGVFVGTPVGVLAGTYLAEYARHTRLAALIRFVNDILLSAPSIVIGLFIYEVVVRPMGAFSGWAGGLALSVIILPIVVRTTDEMLQLVPGNLREAALALGLPQWKITTQIVYRAAKRGVMTGVLLGIARISGETAPLLFTALGNQFWTPNPADPMASVPVAVFQLAMSPYADWHALAWGGAMSLTAMVLLLNIVTRVFLRPGSSRP